MRAIPRWCTPKAAWCWCGSIPPAAHRCHCPRPSGRHAPADPAGKSRSAADGMMRCIRIDRGIAMSRRLSAAPLAAAIAFATAASAASGPTLTIYGADNDALFSGAAQGSIDAGHAVVHEQRALTLQPGAHAVRIAGLPATIDPEAVAVGFGNGSGGGALAGQIGRQVEVTGNTGQVLASGTLVGADDGGLTVRLADCRIAVVRDYASVLLPPGAASGGSTLLLDVDAKSGGTRDALLTYSTSGLGWRAAYTATLQSGGSCRMRFDPQASVANRSGRDYDGATIKLVAGQPNLGGGRVRMYSMAAAPVAAEAAPPMPVQGTLGDYRSFTLPGAVTLPSGTVTLTPLYPAQDLACQRQYVLESGASFFPPTPNTNDYGGQGYQDRPVASTLSFSAPEALPAGTLRAFTLDRDGAPELLGQGTVNDTPKGRQVSVQLG